MTNSAPALGARVALKGARLELGPISERDLPALAAAANDESVARNLARLPHPYTAEDARYFFETVCREETVWRVTAPSGEFAGVIGLRLDEPGGHPELGYWLGRAFWGRGYATEAARLVVDFAFRDLAAAKIVSGFFDWNAASRHVLEKIGFRETNRRRVFNVFHGEKRPHVDMALSREDWAVEA